MSQKNPPYYPWLFMTSLIPLGDQAALAYFADETSALQFALAVRQANDAWLIDVVQAYASVAVFYDLDRISFNGVATRLTQIAAQPQPMDQGFESRRHLIPCCYEFHLDLERVAKKTGLSPEDVIRLHSETEYVVYAIGFCPGFPFLGYLPPALTGVPRLDSPRKRVEAGSIGLTGRQSGIYTEVRPGGWNIVGRTPLELVNVEDGYFPIRTGDRVRFEQIDEIEYRKLLGKRF
jgi:inhibitor of KinA